MKAIVLAAGLLSLVGASAHAKLAPYEPAKSTESIVDHAALTRPHGAIRESHYFNAPPAAATGRASRCRTQVSLFDKLELAQWC